MMIYIDIHHFFIILSCFLLFKSFLTVIKGEKWPYEESGTGTFLESFTSEKTETTDEFSLAETLSGITNGESETLPPTQATICNCPASLSLKSKYATSFRVPSEPTSHAVNHCIMAFSAKEFTDTTTSEVTNGDIFVSAAEGGDKLLLETRMKENTSVWEKIFGKARKEHVVRKIIPLPIGCMYYRSDPDAAYSVEQRGSLISWVRVRLTPELFAHYNVSTDVSPPIDESIATSSISNMFAHRGNCIYTMQVKGIDANSLILTSSLRHVQIHGKRRGTPIVISTMEYNCQCKPERYGHVAFWVKHDSTSDPEISLHVGKEYNAAEDICFQEPLRRSLSSAGLNLGVLYSHKPFTRP